MCAAARDVRRIRFKLGNKQAALETLARALQMFVERTEVSGPQGGPIEIMQRVLGEIDGQTRMLPVRNGKANGRGNGAPR